MMQDDVSMDSYHRVMRDHRVQAAIRDAGETGRRFALAFRAYQAALTDASYWDSEEARERNKQQVGEAFDALVRLTDTILGNKL